MFDVLSCEDGKIIGKAVKTETQMGVRNGHSSAQKKRWGDS